MLSVRRSCMIPRATFILPLSLEHLRRVFFLYNRDTGGYVPLLSYICLPHKAFDWNLGQIKITVEFGRKNLIWYYRMQLS